jgi:hypothetical protein
MTDEQETTPPTPADTMAEAWEQLEPEDDTTDDDATAGKAVDGKSDELDATSEAADREDGDTDTDAATDDDSGDGDTEAEAADQASEEVEDSSGTPEPLEHWPEEFRERFNALPEDDASRQYALDVHKHFEAKYRDRAREVADREKSVERYSDLSSFFEPFQTQLAAAGTNDVAYTKHVINWAQAIRENPLDRLKELGKSYGYELIEKADAPRPSADDQTADDEYADPRVRTLETRMDTHEKRLADDKLAAQQNSQAELETRIKAFTSETDADGNLKHPHFNRVWPLMGAVCHASGNQDLEKAYDNAIWADPELRAELTEAQKSTLLKEQSAKRKEDVQKAKKASKHIKSRSAPVESKAKPAAKVHESLAETWDQLSGPT